MTIHLLEWIIKNIYVPGKVENNVYIINLKGISIFSMPFSILKELGAVMEKNYRTKLFRLYVLNAPLTMTLLFSFFKNFDSNIQKKIFVTRNESANEMWEHINKEQLENRFGGSCANLEGPYWPPQASGPNVFISPEDKSNYY
jgi:hypothetical protein